MPDVSAIVVRLREHPDHIFSSDVRYTDARHAAVDSLGHLTLYTGDATGVPRRILGMVAAGCWSSWRVDTTPPCPGTCPPLATVTSLPTPSIAQLQRRVS